MNPEEVNIVLKQDGDKKATSHNVIATIPGTEKPEEIITFTAHYDSVIYSSGAWDNGTGSLTIMELMHYFNVNKPKRTLKFIWCGSEEIGLVGSRAYCEKHQEEMKNTLFNINVDMTGTLLGFEIAVCSCEESCAKYIDYLGKIEGFPIKTSVDMYSSDSSSFAVAGVPAVTFARLAPRGGAEIHSRRDVFEHLDPVKFINTVEFMAKFSENVVNAKVFPVSREIPKELAEKLDRFKKMGESKKVEPEKKENKETEKVENKEEK
jgi:Zn-dependent M28 family amino/carboxypeptidase